MEAKLISAVFEVDGKTIVLGEGGVQVAPRPIDPGLYDEAGWTIEMTHGCAGNRAVDEHLAAMAVGDQYQQEIAAKAATRFAVLLPGRAYDADVKVNLVRNYQQDNDTFVSGYLGGWMFEPFSPYLERQANGAVKMNLGLEGFTTPIFGFNPNVVHAKLAAEYIDYLNRSATGARTRAENPNAPKVSPGR